MENFLGMNRQVLTHWVYSDIYAWRVWSHILFSAQFSKTDNHVNVNGYWITQEYGEFLFGRDSWSSKLQVPEQRLRTLMKKFEKEEMIRKTEKGNSRCSVYAVCNYAKFNQIDNQHANQQNSLEPQAFEEDANQHSNRDANQRPTSDQPATNHNKEYKKKEEEYKEDKQDKHLSDLDSFFERAWKLYPRKEGKGSVSKTQKKKLYDLGDEFIRCIERYIQKRNGKDPRYTQMGSTFFNSGYVDYLDINYGQPSFHQPTIEVNSGPQVPNYRSED